MPTAERSLKPTGFGWTMVIYVAYCTAVVCSGNPFTCQAPTEYGPVNKVTCNVSYTDTLMLECPDPASHKSATWRKAVNKSYSVSICNAESPECTLNPNRNLTNQDSGLYFCELPAANGSDRSYVEITALAPPSLLNVAYCAKGNASLCTRQSISAYFWDRFTVTIEFSGIGPFSVLWKHNNSDFDCQQHCHEENSTNKMSLQFLANPNPPNATGEYSAIVSNHYGWNVSVTSVDLTHCGPVYNPQSISSNTSIALMDGANTTLSCKLKADSEYSLTVCYGKYNQNFNVFTDDNVNDKYCTFCFPNSHGACNSLPPKPEWAVYRKEGGECGDILENDIMIKDFSKNDEGIIVCFYGDDEVPYHLYTTHTLTYETGTSKLPTVYIIVGAVAILVFMILLAILAAAAYWYRRTRRHEPQNDTLEDPLDRNIQTQQQSRSRRRSQQHRNRHRSQQQGRSRTLGRNYGATAATRQLDQAWNPASSCPESDVTDLLEESEDEEHRDV